MRLTLLLALLFAACPLAACKMTQAEVDDLSAAEDRRSERSFAEARAGVLAKHRLTPVAEPPLLIGGGEYGAPVAAGTVRELARAPAHGLIGGETIVELTREGAAPVLALHVPSCANGQSCSCLEPALYLPARAVDGAIVVVRLVARDHTRRVRQEGACGVGCGVPSPPQPASVYPLAARSPDEVRIINAPFDRYHVAATCDRVVYAP